METAKHQAPKNKKSRRRSQQRQTPAQRALEQLGLSSLWPRVKKSKAFTWGESGSNTPEAFLREAITGGVEAMESKLDYIKREGRDPDDVFIERLRAAQTALTYPTACLYEELMNTVFDMAVTPALNELGRVWELIRHHPGLAVDATNIRALLDAAKELDDLTNPALSPGRESDIHYQENVCCISPFMERAKQQLKESDVKADLETWASFLEDVAEMLRHHPKWEREVALMRTIATSTANLLTSKVLEFAASDQPGPVEGEPPQSLSMPAAIYFRDAVDQIHKMPTDDDKIAAFEGLRDLVQHHPGLQRETAGLTGIIKGEMSILNSPAISWANAR
jgi:hypothetical protein